MTEEEYALVEEHVRKKAEGCCGDDSWRGRFCQYHEGFLDGWEDGRMLVFVTMNDGHKELRGTGYVES
jgi:hypothetical protein